MRKEETTTEEQKSSTLLVLDVDIKRRTTTMNEASTVQSPNPALSYDMEQPPIKPTQLSSAAMPEPTLSSSSPSQCKRLSSNTTAEMPPQSQLQDQLSGQRIVIE